ncbi:GatB/YqeY domain-containing protein [Parasphingorhabdus pacifica]
MRQDLTAALKGKDPIAIAALRSGLAAIDNAAAPVVENSAVESEHVAGAIVGHGAAEVERLPLTEPELRGTIEAQVQQRSVVADEYDRLGRDDLAQRMRAEADVPGRYVAGSRSVCGGLRPEHPHVVPRIRTDSTHCWAQPQWPRGRLTPVHRHMSVPDRMVRP